jgi:hypothetical protein
MTTEAIRIALADYDAAQRAMQRLNDRWNGVATWPEDAQQEWGDLMERLLNARDSLGLSAVRFLLSQVP